MPENGAKLPGPWNNPKPEQLGARVRRLETEKDRLKELALAHASALDECRAENKRLRLVLAERDEQVANLNTAMQTAMSAHTIEQARKVLREGVLNA